MSAPIGDVELDMSDAKLPQATSPPPAYHPSTLAQPKKHNPWLSRLRALAVAVLSCLVLVKLLNIVHAIPYNRGGHRSGHGHRHGQGLSPAEAEKLFLSLPDPDQIRNYSRSYTTFAHYAGTEGDFHSVKITEQRWADLLGVKSSGVLESGSHEAQDAIRGMPYRHKPSVHVDTYHSLLNYPLGNSSLSMTAPNGTELFKAKLFEPPVEKDKTSKHGTEDVPFFHGFSKAGSAEGQLVYANMGRVEDYERLKQNGIDLKGKIAMVRYGGNFRGLKISAGELYGIAGVIIYTDPIEDGEITEANGYKAYPDGPARHPLAVQRGSVQKLSIYAGDPLTPGYPVSEGHNSLAG